MIYLEQNEEIYNNDIRAMLQAFFDNEKVVIQDKDTRLSLKVCYEDGKKVSYYLKDVDGYQDEDYLLIPYRDKKIARNILKERLYRMLSKYTNKTLPWGTMTGVRPTKVATELIEQGISTEQIRDVYTKTYLTQEQKADICIEVAKAEQDIFQNYHYREEYCLYIGIPFCPSRCLYCSFTSYPIAMYNNPKKDGFAVADYLQALLKEMEFVASSDIYRNKKLVAV